MFKFLFIFFIYFYLNSFFSTASSRGTGMVVYTVFKLDVPKKGKEQFDVRNYGICIYVYGGVYLCLFIYVYGFMSVDLDLSKI